MTVTLHSTDKVVTLVTSTGEVPARLWEGHTESGVPCHAFVTCIGVHKHEDTSQFERELVETHAPVSPALNYPLRLVI